MKRFVCVKVFIFHFLIISISFGFNTGQANINFNEAQLIRVYGVKINVDDMTKAEDFYCGKLGFEIEDRSGYPKQIVLKTDGKSKLILNAVKKIRKQEPKETCVSFTLQVNELDKAIEKMKSLKIEFAEKEPRKEGVGNAISILDPFGRQISLMHQTIIKVEPFKEPKIYNFGYYIPDMTMGRDFYADKPGFVVRSEKYLPLDLPLGHKDKTFGFMLHYRTGVKSIKNSYPKAMPQYMIIYQTENLRNAISELEKAGVKVLSRKIEESPQ